MKKLILSLLCVSIGVCVYASAEFKTSCGYVGTTVSPEYFETAEEYIDYVKELNQIYCGEEGNVSIPRIQRFEKQN